MNFIDTGKDNTATEGWAFLIEPQELMMNRLNGVMVKSDKLSIRTVNKDMMDKLALFQYMIGNGDFSVTGRHNLKLLTLKGYAVPGFVPIPYDFDYTGLVNAHYAEVGEDLGIKTARERYFLGPCRARDAQIAAIRNFAIYKDEIVNYILGFEFLDEDEKMDMIGYLESYFSEADNENFIEDRLAPTCR